VCKRERGGGEGTRMWAGIKLALNHLHLPPQGIKVKATAAAEGNRVRGCLLRLL